MPNLSLIPTQSLVSPERTAAGSGGPGTSAIIGGALGAAGEAARLYQQHQDEQAKVWAGNALSSFHLTQQQALLDQRDAAAKSVSEGGSVPDMTGEYLKTFDVEAQKVIDSAPSQAKNYLHSQMSQAREALGSQMIGQQATLTRQWKVSSFDTSTSNAGRIVLADPSQYDAQMGNLVATVPSIDPETDSRRLLAARESLTNAAASSTLDRDPYALRAITGKAMGQIDPATGKPYTATTTWADAATPEQIKVWNNQAEAKIRQLENASRLDADARERQAGQTFNTLQGFVAQGSVPDMAYIAKVKADTAGTSFEASAAQALDIATRGAGFGSASLPQQQARLEQLQTQQGHGTNPEDAALLKQLQSIHDTQSAAYKDDPLEAAARFTHAPVIPTQQLANTTQALQLVAARTSTLPTIEAATGAPVSPLHPAEAKQLGLLIRAMQPDQAASALSTLGQTINDPQRITAFAKQLGDTDGTLGLAMAYAGDKTSFGRNVSELLLRGDQALKDRTSTEDQAKQTGWRATAATAIRGAFSDVDVENKAIEAALRINAATSLHSQDDMDAAVRMATGGITTHGAADAKIPLPYGMKADDFEKKIAALTPSNFASQVPDGVVHIGAATMPLQQFVGSLKDATLVHAGQGLYNVRGGTTLATNAKGQRITIHITQ